MTECAKCGDCCEAISIGCAIERVLDDEDTPERVRVDLAFMREHWHLLPGYAADNPHYSCDQFDHESRLCTAHETRPPVCRDFPWYERPEGDKGREVIARSLSPRCSFNADVPGRRMLPIVEVNTRSVFPLSAERGCGASSQAGARDTSGSLAEAST